MWRLCGEEGHTQGQLSFAWIRSASALMLADANEAGHVIIPGFTEDRNQELVSRLAASKSTSKIRSFQLRSFQHQQLSFGKWGDAKGFEKILVLNITKAVGHVRTENQGNIRKVNYSLTFHKLVLELEEMRKFLSKDGTSATAWHQTWIWNY